jgi:small subunit ribosomal protein S21
VTALGKLVTLTQASDSSDAGWRRFLVWPPAIQPPRETSGQGGEIMTSVSLRPNESQEQLFKRFKKKVMRSGLLSQLRNKRWFVSKSEVRRIEKKKAIRRINKRKRRDSED